MIGLGNSVVKRKLAGASVPAAPVNIIQPSLSGSGAVGEAVICNKGTWSGSPTPTYTYDFRLDSVSVQNGTSNSYTPLLADDGKTLTCLVTATNSQGSASEGTSNSIVIGVAPSNTVAPTLSPSGTQSTGTVITVGNGTFAGTAPLTYAYRWKRNGSIILGETSNTYTLVAGDDGTVITAEVKATNAYGESTYIGTSNQVDAVNAIAPSNVTAPVISGSTSLGSVLTTTNGTWSGVPATFSYTYQWKRNGSPIAGATASTYTTVVADSLANITCDVTADNGIAPTATAGSNTLTMANYTPANTVAPAVTGTAVVGQTLSTTNGTWTNSPSTFSYQWYRGATLISGATNSTYTLVSADAGQNIKCTVTATNTAGSASADSNTVAILATLLDLYPSAAAAYSVRLLRGAYLSSPAIRVRRSNDNTETDIGFTTAGNLDTTALATFVGSNSGFIVRWYDQSGNANHATQTTPASQHQIVVSGTITTIGARVAMDSLALPALVTTSTFAYTHLISVAKIDTNSTIANYVCSAALNAGGCFYGGNFAGINGLGGFDGVNIRSLTGEDLNRHIGWFSMRSSSLFVQRDNGTETNAGSFPSSLNCVNIIGNNVGGNTYFRGKYQEVILYNMDISSNKSAMITNVNNYYGVY